MRGHYILSSIRFCLGRICHRGTTQHILDNYDVLAIADKNRLQKLVMKKATVYRTSEGELSVHIYPKIPR